MTILQILPRVPPAICGIGDYSWRLAQALRDEIRAKVRLLTGMTRLAGSLPG